MEDEHRVHKVRDEAHEVEKPDPLRARQPRAQPAEESAVALAVGHARVGDSVAVRIRDGDARPVVVVEDHDEFFAAVTDGPVPQPLEFVLVGVRHLFVAVPRVDEGGSPREGFIVVKLLVLGVPLAAIGVVLAVCERLVLAGVRAVAANRRAAEKDWAGRWHRRGRHQVGQRRQRRLSGGGRTAGGGRIARAALVCHPGVPAPLVERQESLHSTSRPLFPPCPCTRCTLSANRASPAPVQRRIPDACTRAILARARAVHLHAQASKGSLSGTRSHRLLKSD